MRNSGTKPTIIILAALAAGCDTSNTAAERGFRGGSQFRFFECKGVLAGSNSLARPEDQVLSLYFSSSVKDGKTSHRIGFWTISNNVRMAFEGYSVQSIDDTEIVFGDGEEKSGSTYAKGRILKGSGYAEIRYGYAYSKDTFRWFGRCLSIEHPVLIDLEN